MTYRGDSGRIFEMPVYIQKLFFSQAGENLVICNGINEYTVKNPVILKLAKDEVKTNLEAFFQGLIRNKQAFPDSIELMYIDKDEIHFRSLGSVSKLMEEMKIPKKQAALIYSGTDAETKLDTLYDLISFHYDDNTNIYIHNKKGDFSFNCTGEGFCRTLSSLFNKSYYYYIDSFYANGEVDICVKDLRDTKELSMEMYYL